MASVWLGRSSTHPEQLVALKVIRPEHGRNKEFVAMFVDEVGIASRLSHPNIVFIRGMGHDGTRHFLVMELLRGHSLLDVWKAAHAQVIAINPAIAKTKRAALAFVTRAERCGCLFTLCSRSARTRGTRRARSRRGSVSSRRRSAW